MTHRRAAPIGNSCRAFFLLAIAAFQYAPLQSLWRESFTLVPQQPSSMLRSTVSKMVFRASADDYPELTRVEELIYESCVIKEGAQELECLRVWDKLKKFHGESALECDLDDMRCVVLDVLDRLCKGIDGKDGLVVLNKVSSAVLLFRDKFSDWERAFDAVDTDSSDYIDMAELTEAMKSVNVGMSEAEVRLVFKAADANGDGKISREEFSDFLTAGVFAEEPLRGLQVDAMPTKQPDFPDYLRWSTSNRMGSWAGLASLSRMSP